MKLDVNADMGESPRDVDDGTQEAMLPFVTRASVACGGHAGDDDTMRKTVAQCARHGVLVGAHPSYPDRAGFGRASMSMPVDELRAVLLAQVAALDAVAREAGVTLAHLKPHGALYHDVARSPEVARVIVDVALRFGALPVIGLLGAPTAHVFRDAGLVYLDETFADRRYEDDGSLRARTKPGALLTPDEAAAQVRRLVEEGRAATLCVHSDSPGALDILRAIHDLRVSAGKA
jgi:UPF0271 protein